MANREDVGTNIMEIFEPEVDQFDLDLPDRD